jgi:3D (Asp-Asp-Asp) domain-containing protein
MGALLLAAQLAIAEEHSLTVVATAYNSTRAQTDAHPNHGAWGDRIEPGMKVIAVSPDLVKKGLERGTKVSIDKLEGEWIVLDRPAYATTSTSTWASMSPPRENGAAEK